MDRHSPYGNCHTCIPTGAPLYHDDPALDARLPDPCERRTETEVDALVVELGGTEYYYAADAAAPAGVRFFVHRGDLGGYAPLDPADPVVTRLLREIGR